MKNQFIIIHAIFAVLLFSASTMNAQITGCAGKVIYFTDPSISTPNDPVVSWNWSFPGGTPLSSTLRNPVVVYPTAGTYSVLLIVTTQQGNKDTIAQQVLVYNPPVAAFTYVITGGMVTFTNGSTSVDGPITSWSWSFPGGTPASSTSQSTAVSYFANGTYSVCLKVTTSYGCVDSVCKPITIASSGINELNDLSSVNVFPAFSSSGIFTVSVLNPQIEIEHLYVYDMVGKKVLERASQQLNGSTTQPIDLSKEKNGVYFITINTASGIVTKKIVIHK